MLIYKSKHLLLGKSHRGADLFLPGGNKQELYTDYFKQFKWAIRYETRAVQWWHVQCFLVKGAQRLFPRYWKKEVNSISEASGGVCCYSSAVVSQESVLISAMLACALTHVPTWPMMLSAKRSRDPTLARKVHFLFNSSPPVSWSWGHTTWFSDWMNSADFLRLGIAHFTTVPDERSQSARFVKPTECTKLSQEWRFEDIQLTAAVVCAFICCEKSINKEMKGQVVEESTLAFSLAASNCACYNYDLNTIILHNRSNSVHSPVLKQLNETNRCHTSINISMLVSTV